MKRKRRKNQEKKQTKIEQRHGDVMDHSHS